jgi:uncharacterized membrane protein
VDHPSDAETELDAWLDYAGDETDRPKPRHPAWLRGATATVIAATLLGLILLWPGDVGVDGAALSVLGIPSSFDSAEVVSVEEGPCPFIRESACTDVVFLIETGPDAGATYDQSFPLGDIAPDFVTGQRVVLSRTDPQGTVVEGMPEPCSFDRAVECRVLRIRLNNAAGTIVEAEVSPENLAYASFAGDELNLDLFEEDGEFVVFGVAIPTIATTYQFADFQRRALLFWVFALFAVAVVAIGRLRGLMALAGLALSLMIVLLFVVRGIVAGGSPLAIAVVGAAAITIVTLYLAHGMHPGSSVALLGVIGAILLTAGLGSAVLALANITGFSSEEVSLLTLFEGVQVRGLLLAGVVLGAAGALDDVAVTQAATVRELRSANPSLAGRELYRRGMRVGRDHIASTVNTLLLAYAGASLPLLVLFVLSRQSLGTVANSEVVAIEALRTLVGSLGLLATVPFTTWLASIAAGAPAKTSPG